VGALQRRYGPSTLIHWEDLAPPQARGWEGGASWGVWGVGKVGAAPAAAVRAHAPPTPAAAQRAARVARPRHPAGAFPLTSPPPRAPRRPAPQTTASPRGGRRQAFGVLQRLRSAGTPTFNDDIEATAAAAVAALLGACRLPGVPGVEAQRFLFFGAGQARGRGGGAPRAGPIWATAAACRAGGALRAAPPTSPSLRSSPLMVLPPPWPRTQANLGTARLIVRLLADRGVPEPRARASIWMIDRRGLLTTARRDLSPEKAEFAQAGGWGERGAVGRDWGGGARPAPAWRSPCSRVGPAHPPTRPPDGRPARTPAACRRTSRARAPPPGRSRRARAARPRRPPPPRRRCCGARSRRCGRRR
jgi:hypothetical protein